MIDAGIVPKHLLPLPREHRIMRQRRMLTWKEIAERESVSVERVRQLADQALWRIAKWSKGLVEPDTPQAFFALERFGERRSATWRTHR